MAVRLHLWSCVFGVYRYFWVVLRSRSLRMNDVVQES